MGLRLAFKINFHFIYYEGELERTIADLDESNSKLAILKAEKDAAKGVHFPVLNLGNKHTGNDKARDKQRDMHDMETTLKEYLVIYWFVRLHSCLIPLK